MRCVAQLPTPQPRSSAPAAPGVSRRALGLSGFGAALLLLRGDVASASFREDANEKARAKAELLEAARAKAEGRAPRPVAAPAATPAAAPAKSAAPAPKREAPVKAKAVEEVRPCDVAPFRRR